jgi:hypothetical protein
MLTELTFVFQLSSNPHATKAITALMVAVCCRPSASISICTYLYWPKNSGTMPGKEFLFITYVDPISPP